jgi:hypothetical protein
VPVAGGHGEQRLGDLPAALIVVYDAGHTPILAHPTQVSLF